MTDSNPTAGSDSDFKQLLQDAQERKAEGNDYFRANKWNEALVAYRTGLNRLPKLKSKPEDLARENPEGQSLDSIDSPTEVENSKSDSEDSEINQELTKARAVLNANIAACYLKLGEHKQAIEACTQALLDDPDYVKALQRRATCNEILNTWSSLTAAQEDYTSLLRLSSVQSQTREIEGKLRSLKPRIEAAQKAETAEMLGKLKGLGDSILGNFGLSTDNFKFEPNGQGGYSMNFNQ